MPDTSSAGDGELLTRLVRWFEEAETDSHHERRMSERDRDYVDHKQFTAEEERILRDRGQPVTPVNKVKEKLELLRGTERKGRSDPKAYARTPNQDTRADAATQALRYIADENRFDVIRSAVHDNLCVEGMGGAEVIVEWDAVQQDYDVRFNLIAWDRLFRDPHSRQSGFTDARYLGVVIWMDRDQALHTYQGSGVVLDAAFASVSASGTYDDKPRYATAWADNRRTRVRVVQIHWKEGDDWWTATYTRGGFLEPPTKSPYLDRHGNATCPLILRSAYVDRENRRYGAMRGMIPIQDIINKYQSKLLHTLSVNQIIYQDGALAEEDGRGDIDDVRQQAARPDGVIKLNPGDFKFEIRRDEQQVEGHFQLLQYAVAQMNLAGPNAAMAGKDPRELSGRAILAQQAGGMVQNEPLTDELRQWTHKIFEAAWMRVRQFWTKERWIRTTGNSKDTQFVGLNHPVTLAEELSRMDPVQAQAAAAQMGLQPNDPRLQHVVRVENDIDDMDVDIDVEEGPDTPSLEIEQFQQLLQMPPQILAQFPPEVIIQASSLRNKDQLVAMLEQQKQSQAAAAQAQAATQQAMQQAQIAKTQADAADKQAQAVERVHKVALGHAEAAPTPIVPGIGTGAPDINPMLQPPQPAAQPAPY